MKIEDPKVTLADEARNGVKEDVRSGFLDWLFSTSLTDESGNQFMVSDTNGYKFMSLSYHKNNGAVYHYPYTTPLFFNFFDTLNKQYFYIR